MTRAEYLGDGRVQAALGGLVVLAIAWALAWPDTISGIEESLFRAINGLPDWIEPIGWLLMQLGSIVVVPVVALACIAVLRDWRLSVQVAVAGTTAWLVAKIAKELADRGRPDAFFSDFEHREVWDGLGFPSGHSAVAMAIAVVVATAVPRAWKVPVLLAAIIAGFMRIYVGAHFPLDVIGGWGIGIAVGSLSLFLPLGEGPADSLHDPGPAPSRRAG